MKASLTFLFCITTMVSWCQNVNYFRISIGPKMEMYSIDNPGQVNLMPHIDVCAGIYLGKNLTENWRAEIGIIKNDYSSKFQLALDSNTFFDGFVYPTLTTYQLPVLGVYEKQFNEKWSFYGRAGFHLFLSRKLSREGVNKIDEVKVNPDNIITDEASITTFSNSVESGNILLRADLGLYFWVNEYLSLEIAAGVKGGTLPLNNYKIDYESNSINHQNVLISTNGIATHLNLGIRYQFAD